MEASGILSAFNSPALNNQGKGVLIGLVDTGIDYRSPLFQNPDGTTRIAGIWDQSVPTRKMYCQLCAGLLSNGGASTAQNTPENRSTKLSPLTIPSPWFTQIP